MSSSRHPSPMRLALLLPGALFTLVGIVLVQMDYSSAGLSSLGLGAIFMMAALFTMMRRLRARKPRSGE